MTLSDLGFSPYDAALIVICPVGAILGSFAQAIVQTIDLKGPPKKESDMTYASPALQVLRGAWLGLRLALGAILGLVIGLYFVGAIQENPATVAKIAALSIMAGYAAPKVWVSQDRIVSAKISKIVHAEIGDCEKPVKDHCDN
jgi:ABC-type Fe3+ transport system permease subunit